MVKQMNRNITIYQNNTSKNKYLFCNAKKIFLKRIDSKTFLLEESKKNTNKSISLTKRNTIIINKNSKILLFSSVKK